VCFSITKFIASQVDLRAIWQSASISIRLFAGLVVLVGGCGDSAARPEGREPVASTAAADQPGGRADAGAVDADEGRPQVSLPGVMREPPEWLVKDAPFDVAGYFSRVPDAENAAPLYLEALFEFSPGSMKRCVSPEDWDKRGPPLQERERRVDECSRQQELKDSRETKGRRAQLVEEYQTAFDKLAQAQSRKRCLFESGFALQNGSIELVASSRRAVLLLEWRVEARVDAGNLAGAIDDVEMALRLSRDLRPRGTLIRQISSLAFDQQTAGKMIPMILGAKGFPVTDCDRLLHIIAAHKSQAIDLLAEGFRGEYFAYRHLLHHLEVDPKTRAGFQLTDVLAQTTAADFASEVDALNRYFRPLIQRGTRQPRELDRLLPEQERAADEMKILGEMVTALAAAIGDDSEPKAGVYLEGNLRIVEVFRRCQTRLGGVECLLALRRWQLQNGGGQRLDLASVCTAAGLSSVPLDEFSAAGEPLRATVRDGEFVIYSVAEDGVDDGAALERDIHKPGSKGDWVFRLPRVAGGGK